MLENPSYTIKTCQMKKLVKVVAFGSSGSGKTTLIKHMDPSLRNIESRKGVATTVAFDLGIVNRGAYKMHVYGTPGNERFKVAISRMGNRVRVAGSAEIGGSPAKKRAASLQTLYKVLHDWFPGAAQLGRTNGVTGAAAQEWKGARPMLPDGPPIVGSSGVPGVWVNLGHGSSGWALACGSARVVADLISGRAPDVDIEGLGIERLGA